MTKKSEQFDAIEQSKSDLLVAQALTDSTVLVQLTPASPCCVLYVGNVAITLDTPGRIEGDVYTSLMPEYALELVGKA